MMADVDRLGAACAIAVFAVVLTAPARARCEGLRLALGTGVASRSVGSGIAFPFELTLQAFPAVSISGGAVAADGTIVYAYGELALNLGVSFGAGGGVGGYSRISSATRSGSSTTPGGSICCRTTGRRGGRGRASLTSWA